MAASKKTKTYWMIGGGAALLLLLFLSRRSGGSAQTPVYPVGVTSPVVMGSNPSYDGSFGGGKGTSYSDYSSQLAAVGQSLSQLSTQLSQVMARQGTTPAPTPTAPTAPPPVIPTAPQAPTQTAPRTPVPTYSAPVTISGLQTSFQKYQEKNPTKNMQNDTYLAGLHEKANNIRLSQISQLQSNFQAYQKTHPGSDMNNSPYLANLHAQANKLRSQLAGG